jgi:protocatechuate 3,4-dioxygenase beta subunit
MRNNRRARSKVRQVADRVGQKAFMQALERRVLMSSISGVVWQDRNGDGVRDPVEPGLSGRTVYIDANDNGTLDSGERTAVSGVDGSYFFGGLPGGSYVVREILPAGYVQTLPTAADLAARVTVASGQGLAGMNFGAVLQVIKLTGKRSPTPTQAGATSGYVSIDGDYSIVGSPYYNSHTGAAAMFHRDGSGNWTQVQDLTPGGMPTEGFYGYSSAISGDFAAVTAFESSIGGSSNGMGNGAVYMYHRLANGTWQLNQTLLPTTDSSTFLLGSTVIMNGGELIVGTGGGQARVYKRNPSDTWDFQYSITGSGGGAGFGSGYGPAVDGNTLVVGANGEDGGRTGATYVFGRDVSGRWTEQQRLIPTDRQTGDAFGWSVAVSGDWLAASSLFDSDVAPLGGAVYLYKRGGDGVWRQFQQLHASNEAAGDLFGGDVAFVGQTLFVGAPNHGGTGPETGSGMVYVFRQNGNGTWTETSYVPTDNRVGDRLGQSIATSGSDLLIGAVGTGAPGPNTGAAYFGTVGLASYIGGSVWQDRNGDGVKSADEPVLAGRTVYIDANDNGVLDGGEVTAVSDSAGKYEFQDLVPGNYVIRQVLPAGWKGSAPTTVDSAIRLTVASGQTVTNAAFGSFLDVQQLAKVTASDAAGGYFAGAAVAVDGDTMVVGAEQALWNGVTGSGAAYVYTRQADGSWQQTQILHQDAAGTADEFGISLALSGNDLFVGAGRDNTRAAAAGAVYHFQRNVAGQWVKVNKYYAADATAGDNFGWTLGLSGNLLATGAPGYDGVRNAGAIYVFELGAGGTWGQIARLSSSVAVNGDNFGTNAVVVDGNVVASGCAGIDLNGKTNVGAVVVFERTGTSTWGETTICPEDAPANAVIGVGSFALKNGVLAFGSSYNDSFYVYTRTGVNDWEMSQKVSGPSAGVARFGREIVFLADGRLAVADPEATADGKSQAGAVFLYQKGGDGVWRLNERINAPDGKAGDQFGGEAMAVGGDYLVVGAWLDDSRGPNLGSAYLFQIGAAGYLTGAAFNDANKNGVKDTGEAGLAGWTVYLDANNNGVKDAGESSTTTSATGAYAFNDLVPGAYTVRLVQQNEFSQTLPTLGSGYSVTLLAGQTFTGDFGIVNQATVVSGVVWNDRNADGVQQSYEPALAGRTVYWDANDNGVLDVGELSTTSSATGTWTLRDILPGARVFRQIVPADSAQTFPVGVSAGQRITAPAGGTLAGVGFGTLVTALVLDQPQKTIPSPGADGAFAEGIAVSGDYAIMGMEGVGDAVLFHRDGTGVWSQVQDLRPAGLSSSGDLFGQHVSIDGDFAAIGAPGKNVNGNANAGAVYLYHRLPNGTWEQNQTLLYTGGAEAYYGINSVIRGSELLITRWSPFYSGAIDQYRLNSSNTWEYVTAFTGSTVGTRSCFGVTGTAMDSSGNTLVVGAYGHPNNLTYGTAYVFERGNNGSWIEKQQLTPSDLSSGDEFGAGVAVDGDLLAISAPGNNQKGSVYIYGKTGSGTWTFSTKIQASDGAANDNFGKSIVLVGHTLYVGAYLSDQGGTDRGALYRYRQNSAGNWVETNMTPSTVTAGAQLGLRMSFSGGTLAVDAPTDGLAGQQFGAAYFFKSVGAGYIQGTVFQDQNNNGTRDAGEPILPAWTVYLDANNNGVKDAGEVSTTTSATGAYAFNDLVPGTYTVRLVQQNEFSQTLPALGAAYNVTLSAGQTYVGDFGIVNQATAVSGLVWNDRNGDGVKDAVEPVLAGRVVYWDANDNGVLDAGELSTTSSATGSWTIRNVLPGARVFRQVVPGDNAQAFPSGVGTGQHVTVPAGGTLGNVGFGTTVTAMAFDQQRVPTPTADGAAGGYVSVDDNYAIVGSRYLNTFAGSAVMYHRDGNGVWSQIEDLTPPGLSSNSFFGWASAISGDYAAVTATNSNVGGTFNGQGIGAVYIYHRAASGIWQLTQTLLPIAPLDSRSYQFGAGVAMNGRDLVVTASGAQRAGRAIVYHLNQNGTWDYVTDFAGSATTAGSHFGEGNGPALSGNTLAIGQTVEVGGAGSGFGYVFERDGNGNWAETARLQPSDVEATGSFGGYVALDGNLLAISEVGASDSVASGGAVYIYQKGVNGTWQQSAKIRPSRPVPGAAFGADVVLSGKALYVGASGVLGTVAQTGAVYIYRQSASGTWIESSMVPTDSRVGDQFGLSLALGSTGLVVGAPGLGLPGPATGGAYFLKAVPAAYLQGNAFQDQNNNGTRDTGEPVLPGWTVYLDANNNGTKDPGEQSTTTDSSGNYYFDDLAPGTYVVRQSPQSQWVQTMPALTQGYAVTLVSGQTYTADFGLYATATVSGKLFTDANNNGVQDGADAPLANWTVFADLNGNRVVDVGEPVAVTAADGSYSLTSLPIQTVSIDALSGAAWGITPRSVVLTQLLVQTGVNLPSPVAAVTPPTPGTLSFGGRLAIDENANAIVDPDELQGVPNAYVKIYRDDGDGIFEPGGGPTGDTYLATVTTDASGGYLVQGVSPGAYWAQVSTTAAGSVVETVATSSSHSLYGRTALLRNAVGAQQLNSSADFSVLSAYIVSTSVDRLSKKPNLSSLSLREAVYLAGVQGAGLILFSSSLNDATITLGSTGPISISTDVVILGPSSGTLTIQSAGNSRLFSVSASSNVSIQNLTLSGGSATTGGTLLVSDGSTVTGTNLTLRNSVASSRGGAIYVTLGSSLTLTNSVLYGNTAAQAGGAIYVDSDSSATLTAVTLFSNSATGATGDGGAIYSLGQLTATNVTIATNNAVRSGGGLAVSAGTATLLNSTITYNTVAASGAGGGISVAPTASLTLSNSLIALNGAGTVSQDVAGAVAPSSAYNLIATGSSGLVDGQQGNKLGTLAAPRYAGLMRLGSYGGSIPTVALRPDSPAIDAGSNMLAAALTSDGAGNPRRRDFSASGTAFVDIGAYEVRPVILVSSLLDESVDTDGKLSLREAVALAASDTGLGVIRFSPSIATAGVASVTLTLGSLDITTPVEIDGSFAPRVILDAQQRSRLFTVGTNALLSLSGLTLTRGSAAGDGGAVLSSGRLETDSVLFVSNTASGSGGAVASSGSILSINSTFAGNSAGSSGGSLYVSSGTATIIHATLADSRAGTAGTNGGTGGNIAVSGGASVTLSNTVLARGTRGTSPFLPDDVAGTFSATSSYNFVGVIDGSSGLNGVGVQYGSAAAPADPRLSDLADHGGPVFTYGVLPGSPVVDTGSDAIDTPWGILTDARGLPRSKDGTDDGIVRTDKGAFEQQYPLNQAPTLSSMSTITGAVQAVAFTLKHETLLAASNAADPEGAPVSFIIDSVLSGAATVDGQSVIPGVTVLSPGHSLVWTPPAIDFAGNRTATVQALRVRAYDGQVASLGQVTVPITVTSTAEEVNYAVLFSGGDTTELNYQNYYDNIKRAYQTLTGPKYNVPPSNIIVVYADGRDPGLDQRGGINSDMSFAANVVSATRANLRQALMTIGALADANDHFFFWTFDHGLGTPQQANITGEEVLRGWGDTETISSSDLRVWLQGLSASDSATAYGVPQGYAGVRAGYNTYVFGQCYAGGMLAPLACGIGALGAGTNVMGVAAANHYEASYADYFISAYTDALDSGYNDAVGAYKFAYSRDGRAARDEAYAPNAGNWQYNVEHPWIKGDTSSSFPIFAVPRNANGVPSVLAVTPLKMPATTTDLTVTYEMLSAALNAVDPSTQKFRYRISSSGVGTLLTSSGTPLDTTSDTQATISVGGSFIYRRRSGSTGTINDLLVRVIASDGTPATSATLVPIRIGDPINGAVAVNDSAIIQFNSTSIPIAVLSNDAGSNLTLLRTGLPSHGSVTIDPSSKVIYYTPPATFVGSDAFSYIVSDVAGNTDIGSVSLNVVAYDPSTRTSGAPNYSLTELGLPPSWAGLPLDASIGWTAGYRSTIPLWDRTEGADIDDQGRVLVRVRRSVANYQPGSFVEYVGGTAATYIWSASSVAPYWNWSVAANATDTNTVLTSLLYTGDSNPHAADQAYHAAVYGLDAASLGTQKVLPARLMFNGDNANSTSQPYLGAMIENPGALQSVDTGQGQNVVLGPSGLDLIPVAVSSQQLSPGVDLVIANDRVSASVQLWSYTEGAGTWSQIATINGVSAGSRSFAEAMLPDGSFVGTESPANSTYLGLAYNRSSQTSTRLAPLGGDTASAALAINSLGVSVGVSAASLTGSDFINADKSDYRIDRTSIRRPGVHAVRWVNGSPQSLGSLAVSGSSDWSVANDINDSGTIVGSSNGLAFIYIGGTMYNLNQLVPNLAPGTVLVSADAINNAGQIVATMTESVGGQTVTRAAYLDLASFLSLKSDAVTTSAQKPVVIRPLDNDLGASFLTGLDTTGLRGTATLDPVTNTIRYDPANAFSNLPANQFPATTQLRYTARDARGVSASSTINITVNALSTFYVTGLQTSSSGFVLNFNQPPVNSVLNLYSGPANTGRPADLVVKNASGNTIPGSLVQDSAAGTSWRFIAQGGPLAPGTYTATLSSRNDGFTSSTLGNLDGDLNDQPGGDAVLSFTIPSTVDTSRVLSISDIARAPGQPLAAPGLAGAPITLTNPQGTTGIGFTLRFDPSALSFSSILIGSALPAGWTLTANTSTPGVCIVSLAGSTPLPAGNLTLGYLTGNIPTTTTPFSATAIRLTDVTINEGALPSAGDDSVLLAALPGDADANNYYSDNDTTLVSRLAVSIDTGLDAFPLIAPNVVADVTMNGAVSPFDAAQLTSVVSGVPSSYLPAIPGLGLSTTTPTRTSLQTALLSARCTCDAGEAGVVYSWSLLSSTAQATVDLPTAPSYAARDATATFHAAGTYTFKVIATTPDGRSIASQAVVTVDPTPTQITLQNPSLPPLPDGTLQPGSAVSLVATVRDQFGNPLAPQPPITLSALRGNIASGVYTAPATGTTDTITAQSGFLSISRQITIISPAPTLSSYTINDGAVQRSIVRSITIAFSSRVSLSPSAIILTGLAAKLGTTSIAPSNSAFQLASPDNGVTWVLTFSTYTGASLPDGIYNLALNPAAITNPATGQALTSALPTLRFHRLFGDSDGDGSVQTNDLNAFNTAYAYSRPSPNYRDYFDYDNNGAINNTDLLQLRQRLGKALVLA